MQGLGFVFSREKGQGGVGVLKDGEKEKFCTISRFALPFCSPEVSEQLLYFPREEFTEPRPSGP